MEKVIAAQARANEVSRQLKAVTKDRDQLLEEYTDMRNAREVPKSPAKANRKKAQIGSVRMAFGDVHGMLMDRGAVDAMLADMKQIDPDEIVLLGDILECGGWLAKHQPIGFIASCDYTFQEDVQAANWLLDQIQLAAPRAEIHYLEGNHEDRIERWATDQAMAKKRDAEFLMEAFGPKAVLRLKDRGIHWYNRHEVHEEGLPRGWIKRGNMYFTHSLKYSKNAARDAATATAGNVTYACTHREDAATVVFPAIGLVKAFNPGCLSQMQPIWKHSQPTSWSQGYALDFVADSGDFQHINVAIWRGESLASPMIQRFKS